MIYCEWCGSSRHEPDSCHTRELARVLNGESFNPDKLADIILVTNIDNLDTALGIGHTLQHDHKNISSKQIIRGEPK